VSFWSFNHTIDFSPDDAVIFSILLSLVLLHPFQSFISGFNRWFAVFVAPDGIMFFGIWFAFGDAIICYFDENIRKFLNRILCLQILSVQSSKAAWCENAAQPALCSFQVGLEKDGEGISVVITIG